MKKHYIGGKGPAATSAPPRPHTALALIPCQACGRRTRIALVPGANDIAAVCECGAVLAAHIHHDGYGNATILSGRIEHYG